MVIMNVTCNAEMLLRQGINVMVFIPPITYMRVTHLFNILL